MLVRAVTLAVVLGQAVAEPEELKTRTTESLVSRRELLREAMPGLGAPITLTTLAAFHLAAGIFLGVLLNSGPQSDVSFTQAITVVIPVAIVVQAVAFALWGGVLWAQRDREQRAFTRELVALEVELERRSELQPATQ